MPANILTVGEGAANSADVTIADGDSLTVCLKDAAGPDPSTDAQVDILLKDDVGQYFKVGDLRSGIQSRAVVLSGPGTYRFTRIANGVSCGVYSG